MDDKIVKNMGIARYPSTPIEVVEALGPMIKNKIVCDLGCRNGDLMNMFKQYAKEVTGVEIRKDYYDLAIEGGHDVIHGDAAKVKLPKADLYYIWVNAPDLFEILDNVKSGWVVIGNYTAPDHRSIRTKLRKMGVFTIDVKAISPKNENGTFSLNILKIWKKKITKKQS